MARNAHRLDAIDHAVDPADFQIHDSYYDHSDADRDINCIFPVQRLREMAAQLRDKLARAVMLLGAASKDGKKALLVCSVSKELIGRFRAGDIVKAAAIVVGGNGGGRPDFAQAGGPDPSKLGEAVTTVYDLVGAA